MQSPSVMHRSYNLFLFFKEGGGCLGLLANMAKVKVKDMYMINNTTLQFHYLLKYQEWRDG